MQFRKYLLSIYLLSIIRFDSSGYPTAGECGGLKESAFGVENSSRRSTWPGGVVNLGRFFGLKNSALPYSDNFFDP